jgi:molybdenum cofactor cytidylyltransferase
MSPDIGHKLLATFDGIPLVRRVALRATRSRSAHVFAVTGFQREDIDSCLAGLDITVSFNPAFASGIASSLVTGLKIPGAMDHDGALILLADMPAIKVEDLDRLIYAFESSQGRSIIRASHAGTPGNPVILPKAIYEQALTLRGDRGAKVLIENTDLDIVEVEIGAAAVIDVDTREELQKQGGTSGLLRCRKPSE